MENDRPSGYMDPMDQSCGPQAPPRGADRKPFQPAGVAFTLLVSTVALAFSLASWDGASLSFAIAGKAVWKGQYWRFITATFIHHDLRHLASSLIIVWLLGLPLERRYGLWRMALLYSVLAVGSGAAQFLAGGVGVGMSGALYGYLGLMMAAGRTADSLRTRLQPLITATMLLLLALCIVTSFRASMPAANTAHLAGLAIGLGLGWALRSERPTRRLAVISLASLALAPATLYMPWSYWWWYHRAEVLQQRGANTEQVLTAVRHAVDKAPRDSAVASLLIYLGRTAISYEAYDQAIPWFTRAMLVTGLPPVAKIELAAAYYQTHRDADARWLLRQVRRGDLAPEDQSDAFHTWYLEWAQAAETQPAGAAEPGSQPADEAPPTMNDTIRRLLDPVHKM